MGVSAKVEQRIFLRTNYYEELTNFYPEMSLHLYFVGPELQAGVTSTGQKNDRLKGTFYRGKITEFIESIGSETDLANTFSKKETLFLGYNPGFGSGYEALLESWACDLVKLLDLRYPVFFT